MNNYANQTLIFRFLHGAVYMTCIVSPPAQLLQKKNQRCINLSILIIIKSDIPIYRNIGECDKNDHFWSFLIKSGQIGTKIDRRTHICFWRHVCKDREHKKPLRGNKQGFDIFWDSKYPKILKVYSWFQRLIERKFTPGFKG